MGFVSRGRVRILSGGGAIFLAAALLLTGCSDDPPQGGTIEETTPAKSASPSPSPTPSASAEEQKAIDAATVAFERWVDLTSQIGRAPQNYTISQMKTELYKLGGDPHANDILSVLRTFKVKGWAYGDARTIDRITPDGVKVDVAEGHYPEVLLRVCSDSSKVSLIDAKTRKVVKPPAGQPKAVNYAKVWFYENAWHVVGEDHRSEGERC